MEVGGVLRRATSPASWIRARLMAKAGVLQFAVPTLVWRDPDREPYRHRRRVPASAFVQRC